jgi:uncharacterized membrane protein YgcG
MHTLPLAATVVSLILVSVEARGTQRNRCWRSLLYERPQAEKKEHFNARNNIAIAAAAVFITASMTTGAMAGRGGGGGHGGGGAHFSGGGGRFAGAGGHYGGGYGGGYGRVLGAGGVGIGVGLYGYAGNICEYGGSYYGTPYCADAYNNW